MEKIEFKDLQSRPTVEFDGTCWTFHQSAGNVRDISHESVVESPFLLVRELESIGPPDLLTDLSRKSKELESIIFSFVTEKKRLEHRIVLFEKTDYDAVDEFVDQISLTGNLRAGFTVETAIAGDYYDDFLYNAWGEIPVERRDNEFTAEELVRAIKEVTNDRYDRLENIEWSWNEILENLQNYFPKLTTEITELVKSEGEDNG